jgi:hypothetical protein
LRIWERENGVCHLCELPIQAGEKWEANHDPALINGGENRESKIFPAHIKCHAGHTREAKAEKSKVAAVRKKHLRIIDPPKMQSRGFTTRSSKSARREQRASSKPSLPPKRLFGTAIQEIE